MPSDWPQDASPMTREIGGNGTATLSWTVPAGVVVKLESVYAEIDTSAGTVHPLLTERDNSGAVIARKRQNETADDPALSSATWALRLADDSSSGSLPTGFGLGAGVGRTAAGGGAQVIAPNVQPLITFNELFWASPGMVNLVTQPTLVTIPVDGMWFVTGELEWTGNAGDVDARSALVDTVPAVAIRLWDTRIYKQDAFNFHQSASGVMRLPATTVLRLRPLQRSAGNRSTFAILSCQWMGPLI